MQLSEQTILADASSVNETTCFSRTRYEARTRAACEWQHAMCPCLTPLRVLQAVCLYSIQFICEHHRECHQGRLLVNFEGRTWQVLNAGVRDRLSDIGRRHMKWFRITFATIVIYYFTYLWWASHGLDICNAAEAAVGALWHSCALRRVAVDPQDSS